MSYTHVTGDKCVVHYAYFDLLLSIFYIYLYNKLESEIFQNISVIGYFDVIFWETLLCRKSFYCLS